MPVAAVHKDRHPLLGEYDVRGPSQGRLRTVGDAVSEASGVQQSANCELG